ncbi:MAG TPA: CvpA family protein [Casimicrobiaceae bacterium]|nr:CvpA family protein [Casimicrobiaceae bacterium]
MTTFDWTVILVVGLSTLFAFFRGVVRELIALIAWVLGFIGAIAYAPALGAMLPDISGYPSVRYLIAFALIIICALLAGALIAWPLTRAIHAAGLGFVDRFLGSIFGAVRGAAFVLAFVLVAGLTPLPRTPWWQSSALVPPLVASVLALRPYLPAGLISRLDYSPGGSRPGVMPVERTAPIDAWPADPKSTTVVMLAASRPTAT